MAVLTESDAAKYYAKQPKKRIGAAILVFNKIGQILVVKPNYLGRWLYPGGGVNNPESPLQAAIRECQEEIGISFANVWPAYINYVEPQPKGYQEMLQCFFTTDPVDEDFLNTLSLQKDEIDAAKFVDVSELVNYVGELRSKPTLTYLTYKNDKSLLYLENGLMVN